MELSAFSALRYDPTAVGDPSEVLAPPYDTIDAEVRDALYARHPANVVRVESNRPEPGDDEDARYQRAQANLHDWLAQGLLRQDPAPSFYVLSQTFALDGGPRRTRTGFFARARLTRFGEGPILPHERTLQGPQLDRLRLLRATRAEASPIFGLYEDADHHVLAALEAAQVGPPLVTAELAGVEHRLWRVEDPGAQDTLRSALAPKRVYLADGHLRYETALAYRDERRRQAPTPDAEGVLMYLCAAEDPGLVALATHRVVRGAPRFDEAWLSRELPRYFTVTEAPDDLIAATAALARAGEEGVAFLMVGAQRRAILTLRPDAPLGEVRGLVKHPALRRLDVSVLHAVVLEHIIGLSAQAQLTQQSLRYVEDDAEAFGACARDPEVQVAFLLNPTPVSQILKVCDAGEVMPPKATHFHPSLPAGLVMYSLDEGALTPG